MQISSEQARLAAEQLRSTPDEIPPEAPHISAELMARVFEEIDLCPETRRDRVAAAREHLEHGDLESSDVARMMISRIVSDALR
jgi:hypothetical protein